MMTSEQRRKATEWLRTAKFPDFPFQLRPGITVHGEQFRKAIILDLETFNGPRERTGALQEDLRDIARVCGYRKEEE